MEPYDDRPEKNQASAMINDIRRLMKENNISSIDEANVFLGEYKKQQNERQIDDFQGLSSTHMFRFLNFPFESPQYVKFADVPPEECLTAPIMRLFAMLVKAIGEKGLKPTETGNLPRNLVREIALEYWDEENYKEQTHFGEYRTEPEFMDLHKTRVIAELAGLIRKYKGKFILSRACRTMIANEGFTGVYSALFQTFATNYNWGYLDRYYNFDIIQRSFLFTAYLLHKFGDEWRDSSFYFDAFIKAFPQTLDEASHVTYGTPESTVSNAYILRAFHRGAKFMGLVEMRELKDSHIFRYEIIKTPLLDRYISFHIQI